MPDVSAILRSKAFWIWYTYSSDEPLDDDVLRHFDTKAIEGRDYSTVVISLPCGGGYSIEVDMVPHQRSVHLGLQNPCTGLVSQMGWWDEARWHPHALRWPELTRLHGYWMAHPHADIHPSTAFLLLAMFVGHGVDDRPHLSDRKDVLRSHYTQLQLFTEDDIAELTDKTLVLPSEDDYRWTQDDELGWVFGGEYSCYSIRNRDHSDGSEGGFPFDDWSLAMNEP